MGLHSLAILVLGLLEQAIYILSLPFSQETATTQKEIW